MTFHYRETLSGDRFEGCFGTFIVGLCRRWTGEGFNEDYAVIGVSGWLMVEAEGVKGHYIDWSSLQSVGCLMPK